MLTATTIKTQTPITDAACEELRRVLGQVEIDEQFTGGKVTLCINTTGVRVESVFVRTIRGVINLIPRGHTYIRR